MLRDLTHLNEIGSYEYERGSISNELSLQLIKYMRKKVFSGIGVSTLYGIRASFRCLVNRLQIFQGRKKGLEYQKSFFITSSLNLEIPNFPSLLVKNESQNI